MRGVFSSLKIPVAQDLRSHGAWTIWTVEHSDTFSVAPQLFGELRTKVSVIEGAVEVLKIWAKEVKSVALDYGIFSSPPRGISRSWSDLLICLVVQWTPAALIIIHNIMKEDSEGAGCHQIRFFLHDPAVSAKFWIVKLFQSVQICWSGFSPAFLQGLRRCSCFLRSRPKKWYALSCAERAGVYMCSIVSVFSYISLQHSMDFSSLCYGFLCCLIDVSKIVLTVS